MIIVRAILPAFLYFAGIFLMVHFKAKAMGLKGLSRAELPKGRDLLAQVLPAAAPGGAGVSRSCRAASFTMAYCAVVSCLVAIVAGMMDRERGFGRKLLMVVPGIPLLVYAFGMVYLPSFFPTFQDVMPMRDLFRLACFAIFFVLVIIFTLAVSEPNREERAELRLRPGGRHQELPVRGRGLRHGGHRGRRGHPPPAWARSSSAPW